MKPVQWFIARKYFSSKATTGAVNILGFISMLGITACTIALVVVLSAFNGLEHFSKELFNTFDPDLKVIPATGKYASGTDSISAWLKQFPEIESFSFVLEEKVYLRKGDREFVAILKGVDSNYLTTNRLSNSLMYGHPEIREGTCMLGIGVAYHLGMSERLENEFFQVYAPRADARSLNRPERAFSLTTLQATGVFTIQPEVDEKYAIVSLDVLRRLTYNDDAYSAIEVRLKNPKHYKNIQNRLKKYLNGHFVYNRDEQQEVFFKIMQAEKLVVYLIFTFIALLASFGLMGSLRMLILEKRQNIYLLQALGLTRSQISSIFRITGLMIVSSGVFLGMLLGTALVWFQDVFGMVKLGDGYLVESYPVEIRPLQLLIIAATVLTIGYGTNFAAVAGLPRILKISGRIL